jgi:hypothetical protein
MTSGWLCFDAELSRDPSPGNVISHAPILVLPGACFLPSAGLDNILTALVTCTSPNLMMPMTFSR